MPNLLRYNVTHPNKWKKDYAKALEIENVKYSDVLVEFISSLLALNYVTNIHSQQTQQTSNNLSLTNAELKMINKIRKIKHKIIPQYSTRKKIFDRLKKIKS